MQPPALLKVHVMALLLDATGVQERVGYWWGAGGSARMLYSKYQFLSFDWTGEGKGLLRTHSHFI